MQAIPLVISAGATALSIYSYILTVRAERDLKRMTAHTDAMAKRLREMAR